MLSDLVGQRRAAILTEWFERVLAEYPDETARFLRDQPDRFANPVGVGLKEELGTLLDGLVEGWPEDRLAPALDKILRIRAVQDMPPSRAVGFVLYVKELIGGHVHPRADACGSELAAFEQRVDALLLAGFNQYVACREQLYSIRVNEIRNRSLKNMERLNEWLAARDGSDGLETVDSK